MTRKTIRTRNLRNMVLIIRDIEEIKKLDSKLTLQLKESGNFTRYSFASIIGRSDAIREAIAIARKYARVNATILIEGETGVGKEVFAQSIHAHGPRYDRPFVAVNCAAITESLFESELFGYEAGAFTGADRRGKMGYFEIANGGTIFLDEISEMSPSMQGRLLRMLQKKQIMRVGGSVQIPVDVRVIAATNKNLIAMVDAGEFREDLYYRINVLRLRIPPLRLRPEDIELLIAHYLSVYSEKGRSPQISPELMQRLRDHEWPGNAREIRNFCERLSVVFKDETVERDSLEKYDLLTDRTNRSLHATLKDTELAAIRQKLQENGGNLTKTAEALGISRTTLWRRLNK